MPEKTLSQIPPALREFYKKGKEAVQRDNLDYAVTIFTEVLQKEPAFLECREALRMVQARKAGGGGFFKKMIGSAHPALAKGQMALKNNPAEAMASAEQVLNSDPNSVAAHKLLAQAALSLDLNVTAIQSLEIARRNAPKDRQLFVDLADAYLSNKQVEKAEAVLGEWLRANPTDAEMSMKLKNFSAHKTMGTKGYETVASGEGSYRDILKDETEARQLEQESRQFKSGEELDKQIEETEDKLRENPADLKVARKLADLYARAKNYARALKYYTQLLELDASDPELARALTQTTLHRFDQRLEELDPQAPDYEEQKKVIEKEKSEFQLIDVQRRIERYPNDNSLRFELGQLLFKAGRVNEAIQELQKASRDPHRRIQALNYLGQCFASRGMYDLAAKQLETALKEKIGFDDEKKDLIYNLGCVFEKMGKKEAAIEQFKQIYENDIGYRDVAAKIDAYYSSPK